MKQPPMVAVFSTGGTIASVHGGGEAVSPSLTATDLVRAVPRLASVATIKATQFRQVPSPELTLQDMIGLRREVARALAGGAVGAVVTQGTDTLEETSFALDLLWEGEAPVVFTAAMRNPDLPGADGPANLLASVLVATSAAARGLGALVVMNDEVHVPLFVHKSHTANPATFHSPLTGPIGWITEDRPRIALRPVVRHHIELASVPERVPPVALVKVAIGADGRLLGALETLGYQGVVIEGTGGGHVPSSMVEPLTRLAAAVPVVLTSRTGSGELLRVTYGFRGSETDLLRRGLIYGGILDGLKARVLLTLLLAAGAGRESIGAAFEAVGVPGSQPALRFPS